MLKLTATTLAAVLLASAAMAQTKPSPTPAPTQRKARPVQQAVGDPGEASGMRDAGAGVALSKSAEFSFRRGDLEVTIHCAESEPIKPCADAALTLMDKFGNVASSLPQPPAPPPPPSVPAPSAATTP